MSEELEGAGKPVKAAVSRNLPQYWVWQDMTASYAEKTAGEPEQGGFVCRSAQFLQPMQLQRALAG